MDIKKIQAPVTRAATEVTNVIKIELDSENESSDLIELLAKLLNKEKQLENFDKENTCEYGEQVFTFTCESELNTTAVINLTKYSSLQKLLRVTGCVLGFVHNIRNRLNKRRNELWAEEIKGAENFWIRLVQRDAFAEVNCLLKSKLIFKTSVILEFNPFLDTDELLRVGGRLQKSKFTYLQKHLIILPAKHYFVNLIVRDSHNKVFSGGISETLLEIRERFWLIKGKETVKPF
ncbi:integrase catalytic domain-containing protein [Trichonephila clavata]|uniref:Integrase catalytic domain-containing protein n=1 Tax=Trichonephila clavata TaxID=2740835 RepID=A0A8X6H3P0_TRICU|nr:integrase catalytic domain-containing protein [Trichonephila clavata]